MRRTLISLPVLALLSGCLVALLPATVSSAGEVSTVWRLVNRTCTGNEVEAGRACFDPTGHAADYESVGESSATSTAHGEQQTYTYELPDVVAVGQDNSVDLTAMVSQVTDGGAHARFCVVSDFAYKGTDEPCATTSEAANGGSASAGHTVTLIPVTGASGQRMIVTVGFEEPGGHVTYDYEATNRKTKVTFSFSGAQRGVKVDSSGSFDVVGSLRDNMTGGAPHGAATLHVTKKSGATHTVHLVLRHALYDDPGSATLAFQITQSNLRCAKVGTLVTAFVENRKTASYEICNTEINLATSSPGVEVQVHAG